MVFRQWVNHARSGISTDFKYQSVHSNGHARGPSAGTVWKKEPELLRGTWSDVLRHKRTRLGLVAALLIILGLFALGSAPSQQLRSKYFGLSSVNPLTSEGPQRPRYLHLLVSEDGEDEAGLCKTLLSSSVLGYPSPNLVNWGQNFSDPDHLLHRPRVLRAERLQTQLDFLDESHDDDLALVVEGRAVWFQLRPSTLIERYFKIIDDATKRLQRDMGSAAVSNGIEQRIVFAAQKNCHPSRKPTAPACYAVPESPLPRNIYADHVEATIGEGDDTYNLNKVSPRHLNAGMFIGPVSAMRVLALHARQMADLDQTGGSDDGLYARIFGEQEFQRQALKYRSRGRLQKMKDWRAKKLGRQHSYHFLEPGVKDEKIVLPSNPVEPLAWEFGITLDYEGTIMQPTNRSERDTEFIDRADRERITFLTQDRNIPLPPRVGGLSPDITNSQQPYYSSRHGFHGPNGIDVLPVHQTWAQTSLLTNLYTGVSPVTINHNSNITVDELTTEWPKMWYQAHLRGLLNQRALSPQRPVAVTYTKANATHPRQAQYWYSPMQESYANENAGAQTLEREIIPYDVLCGGDGSGPSFTKPNDGKSGDREIGTRAVQDDSSNVDEGKLDEDVDEAEAASDNKQIVNHDNFTQHHADLIRPHTTSQPIWQQIFNDSRGAWWDPRFREPPPRSLGEDYVRVHPGDSMLGKTLEDKLAEDPGNLPPPPGD